MKIFKFPELRQAHCWDCGANAIQSVLAYYGVDVCEDIIMKLAGTNRNGTPISGVKMVARKYNFDVKSGKMTIDDVKRYIDKKIPVILLVQAWTNKKDVNWEEDWTDGHYVVAIGYDSKNIYFEDPSAFRRTFLTYQEFQTRWHDVDKKGKKYINWGMAVLGGKSKHDLSELEHMD